MIFQRKLQPVPVAPAVPALTAKEAQASDDYHNQALDWEASRLAQIESSERMAWKVAFGAAILAILSWVAIVLMMPLKETQPFVIRVDNLTGATDIVTILKDKRIDYEDALDKYWLNKYVIARESYDWYHLQSDYDTVGLLSTPEVAHEYMAEFDRADSIEKTLKNKARIKVKVISIVPDGKGHATVRMIKERQIVDSGMDPIATKHVATVAYEYRNPSILTEALRLVNPFGYQASAYRIDPEMVEADPAKQKPVANANFAARPPPPPPFVPAAPMSPVVPPKAQ